MAGYIPEVNILNGCNLNVAPGEFVGIIGPNGAGKSTLLKAMLGLVTIRSGTVRLQGEDITGRQAHELVERGVGFVPQTAQRVPEPDGAREPRDGLLPAPARCSTSGSTYVCELFPQLGERADQRAGALSGGERQMVAMGRALMLDPSVLLLDEPSAGLSPMLQDEVFIQCRHINETGVAILMVEQNARRCLQVCDRGYVLDQGRNAYTGIGPRAARRPEGHRAVPRHARPRHRRLTSRGVERGRRSPRRLRRETAPGRCPGAVSASSCVQQSRSAGSGSLAGVEALAERVADVAVAAVDRDVVRADAVLDHRAQDLRATPRSR